jgi:hypothetical protein
MDDIYRSAVVAPFHRGETLVVGRRLYFGRFAARLAALVKYARQTGAARIAYVGCGAGLGASMFGGVTGDGVVGVDTPRRVAHAKRVHRRPGLRFASLDEFAAEGRSFDAAVCDDYASFLSGLGAASPHDAVARNATETVVASLAPGGRAIFTAPEALARDNADPVAPWRFVSSEGLLAHLERAGWVGDTKLVTHDEAVDNLLDLFARHLTAMASDRRLRVAVHGTGEEGERMARLVEGAGHTVVGFIDDAFDAVDTACAGLPVRHPLCVGLLGCDAIVFSRPSTACYDLIRFESLAAHGVTLLTPLPGMSRMEAMMGLAR